MFGFSRVSVARLRGQQRALALAAAQVTSTSNGHRSSFRPHSDRNNVKPESFLSKEQLHLQNKFKATLDGNRNIETIYNIIELVEWRGNVFHPVLVRVAELAADSKGQAASLTDRQLAVVFSVFGVKGDSIGRNRRSILLQKTLDGLASQNISLGPLSRNAVLSARLDNNEDVAVVAELQTWEQAGMSPDAETYHQLARAYGLQANSQGIIDIINHMKSESLATGVPVIEALIYSLARSGHYSQADAVVTKSISSMNEVVLRCAVARAAVARGDCRTAVGAISAISSNAKPNLPDNNVYILGVLFDMLESNVEDAVEKIKPFLTTVPDGSTLTDWHRNGIVISRARRARMEGQLGAALAMYSLVHPSYKNTALEEQFLESLGSSLKSSDCEITSLIATAEKMEKAGILKDHLLFLLEATASFGSEHLRSVFDQVKMSGKLDEYISQKPELKRSLAKKLSVELTDTKLTPEMRSSIVADIATILFIPRSGDDGEHLDSFYPIIYSLCGKDVAMVPYVLSKISGQSVRREFSTAMLSSLLFAFDDALWKEKLIKLLSCKLVQFSLFRPNLQQRFIKLIKQYSGTDNSDNMELLAKAVAMSFNDSSQNSKNSLPAVHLIKLICNENLPIGDAEKFVSALGNQSRVSLTPDDLTAAKTANTDTAKVELLQRLRRKGQAIARWKLATVDELEREINHMLTKYDTRKSYETITFMRELLMEKIAAENPVDYSLAVQHLRTVSEKKARSRAAEKLFDVAFKSALADNNFDAMGQLWEVKSSFSATHALAYIAVMLSRKNVANADAVSDELRASAQTINNRSLLEAGEMVKALESYQLDNVAVYLEKKFNLKPYQARRVVSAVKLQHLNKLIADDNFVEAMNMAVEESKAIGAAFGQFELFRAAFTRGDTVLASNVYKMILNSHDKIIAILDMAYAMLESGLNDQAARLLSMNGLTITTRKLTSFLIRANSTNKPEVLRGLFSGLCVGERASTVDLNELLLQLTRLYYRANDFDAVTSLISEVEHKSFPLEERTRRLFDNIKLRNKTEIPSIIEESSGEL